MTIDLSTQLLSALKPMSDMPALEEKGVYLFCLRDACQLSGITPTQTNVLYVGSTQKSLLVRNHFLHGHSGGSTLRRSLGALLRTELGLQPVRRDANPDNADKYRFRDEDEKRLTSWMVASSHPETASC